MLTLGEINLSQSSFERVLWAMLDDGQIQQHKLVFLRYLTSSIASFPLNRHANRLLRSDLAQDTDKFNFDEASFKLASDSFISGYLGQIMRSFVDAYPRQRNFRLTANASAVLNGVSRAAEHQKGQNETRIRHLKEARKTSLHRFISDSVRAGSALDMFMRGELTLSPDNIETVHQSGEALAEICAELADLKARYSVDEEKSLLAQGEGRGVKADIQSLLTGRKVETAEDVQLFMSSLSMILLQAAKPLGTERFTPDEEIFLPPEEAVKLSEFLEKECTRLGLHFNVSTGPDAPLPLPDLPEGSLFKKGGDSAPQKLSMEENLSLVRSLQEWMGQHLAPHQQRMGKFVEQRFATIEEALVDERVKEPTAPVPLWTDFKTAATGREEVGQIWKEDKSRLTRMIKEGWDALKATAKFIFRDEAVYETKKLFNRAAAGSVVLYPVKIADEFGKNFLRDGNGLSRLKARKEGGENAAPPPLFSKKDVKGIFQSTNIRHLFSPLTSSIGTVGLMETMRIRDAVAVAKADNFLTVSHGVLRSAHHQTPQVMERLNLLKSGHPALDAWQKDEKNRKVLRDVLGKKPEDRSEDDYRFLERYFRMVSSSALAVGEEALSPFGIGVQPEKVDSIPDVMQRVLYQPVKNVPDAMLALSFAQGIVKEGGKKFRSVDYVAPEERVITAKQMRAFGRFMERAMARNGWMVAKGGEGQDISAGEVVKHTANGMEKLSEEDIITFANLSLETLKRHVPMEKLLYSITGVEGEAYQAQFREVFTPPASEKPQQENAPSITPPENWQARMSRRKFGITRLFQNVKERLALRSTQDEIQKLFTRTKGETITVTIPSLIQNSLLHNEGVVSSSGIFSAIFRAITYPLSYSYGIVYCKEALTELFTRKNHVLHEVGLAERFMTAAVKSAAVNDGELKGRMQDYLTSLGHLYEDRLGREYSDIPSITTKPVHERGKEDDAIMAKFCHDYGEGLVSLSARLLGKEGEEKRSIEEIVSSTLASPPASLQDALVALSFLHSMIEQDKQLYGATHYMVQDARILKGRELRALAEGMNEQAQAMGFMLVGAEDSRDKAYLPVIGKEKAPFAEKGEIVVIKDGHARRVTNEELIAYAATSVARYHTFSKGRGMEALHQQKVTEVKKNLFQNLAPAKTESSPPSITEEAEAFLASLTPEQLKAIAAAQKPEDMPHALQKRMEEQVQKTSSHKQNVLKRDSSTMALT